MFKFNTKRFLRHWLIISIVVAAGIFIAACVCATARADTEAVYVFPERISSAISSAEEPEGIFVNLGKNDGRMTIMFQGLPLGQGLFVGFGQMYGNDHLHRENYLPYSYHTYPITLEPDAFLINIWIGEEGSLPNQGVTNPVLVFTGNKDWLEWSFVYNPCLNIIIGYRHWIDTPNTVFTGSYTVWNGNEAPSGTIIRAWEDNRVAGQTTIQDNDWHMEVHTSNPRQLRFTINDINAVIMNGNWWQFGNELHLNAISPSYFYRATPFLLNQSDIIPGYSLYVRIGARNPMPWDPIPYLLELHFHGSGWNGGTGPERIEEGNGHTYFSGMYGTVTIYFFGTMAANSGTTLLIPVTTRPGEINLTLKDWATGETITDTTTVTGPWLQSVSPNSGLSGDMIIFRGEGFTDNPAEGYVVFDAMSSVIPRPRAEVISWSDREIVAIVPHINPDLPWEVFIIFKDPQGNWHDSVALPFDVLPPPRIFLPLLSR